MKKLLLILFLAVTSAHCFEWVNGLNMPWNTLGDDFGMTYNQTVFNESFTRYAQAGANTVRVWVHYSANMHMQLYDQNGYFKPLPNQFFYDMVNMLGIAKVNGLKILLSMFSFECVDFDNCYNMIKDAGIQDSYVNNGLIPMLNYITYHGLKD